MAMLVITREKTPNKLQQPDPPETFPFRGLPDLPGPWPSWAILGPKRQKTVPLLLDAEHPAAVRRKPPSQAQRGQHAIARRLQLQDQRRLLGGEPSRRGSHGKAEMLTGFNP